MILRVLLLVGIVTAVVVAAYAFGWISVERVARWGTYLRDDTHWAIAALVFVALFGMLVSAGFPATPFLVTGGFIFGTGVGTMLNVAGAAVGTAAGYFLARTIARDAIERLLSHRGRAVLARTTGFWGVLRMRLIPVIPMAAISYAAGVAKVRFAPFIAASSLGLLPSAWSYAYLADSIVAGASGAGSAALKRIAIAAVLLLVISVVPRLIKRQDPENR